MAVRWHARLPLSTGCGLAQLTLMCLCVRSRRRERRQPGRAGSWAAGQPFHDVYALHGYGIRGAHPATESRTPRSSRPGCKGRRRRRWRRRGGGWTGSGAECSRARPRGGLSDHGMRGGEGDLERGRRSTRGLVWWSASVRAGDGARDAQAAERARRCRSLAAQKI